MTNADDLGYAAAADAYWNKGWRGVLPLRPGTKWPPPPFHRPRDGEPKTSYTGYSGIDPSYPDIMAWAEEHASGNLALRLPDGVIGIDVDDYGSKTGGQAFAEAIKRWGPLPPAPRSSSRQDDLVSGIRLFRVQPGTALETRIDFPELGIGDIEIIQRHHRYAMVWPSRHPEGRGYWWMNDEGQILSIPGPDELPWLPQTWVDGLRVRPRSEILTTDYNVRLALTDGDPSPRVQSRLRDAIRELNMPGAGRHDTALRHVLALLRMGKTGESGVKRALQLLCDVFIGVTSADNSRTPDVARAEFIRMIDNDNAARELSQPSVTDWFNAMIAEDLTPKPVETQQIQPETQRNEPDSPGNDEAPPGGSGGASADAGDNEVRNTDDPSPPPAPPSIKSDLEYLERGFWESRESLAMIYQTAMARMAPPWGTLAHCAARALAQVRPHVVLPPLIGGPGSLNWFVATVARASGGKGASAAAANVLVPRVGYLHRKIGSGEGIIAAYGKTSDDDSPPEHECIMFTTNEIDALQAVVSRNSSTTLPIFREGFFGEDLGFAYSAKDKRRHIPEHSYRMTLIIAAQPKKMGWLLADVDGGTPQRFMWFPASDKRISRANRPWETGPLTLPAPGEWQYPRTLSVPPEAAELIESEQEKRARDEGDAMDGHALFCREKFAYALTVLDGRTEMTSEDWELSGIAADVSTYTRELSRDAVRDAARIEAIDRGEVRGIELAASDESKQHEEAERVRHALRWALSKIESAGAEGISHRDLTIGADSKRTRRWLPSALQVGASNGLIRQVEGTTTWVKI